jgi:hypothetical protein
MGNAGGPRLLQYVHAMAKHFSKGFRKAAKKVVGISPRGDGVYFAWKIYQNGNSRQDDSVEEKEPITIVKS